MLNNVSTDKASKAIIVGYFYLSIYLSIEFI